MESSSFFNSEENNGIYDREYDASDFAKLWSLFISNGVFANPATSLKVSANDVDMQISVQPGYGFINGYKYENSDILKFNLNYSVVDRTDLVVLQLSLLNREIVVKVKENTTELERTDYDIYELELAKVTVKANATAIESINVVDSRSDISVCGFVTGLIKQIDTTDLFAQYNNTFITWFNNIKANLDENAVASLQAKVQDFFGENNSINSLLYRYVIFPETLNEVELAEMESNNEYMKIARESRLRKKKIIAAFKTAGTFTWTPPEGVTEVDVYIAGAGGSGAACYRKAINTTSSAYTYQCYSGTSGFINQLLNYDVSQKKNIPIVVGAGGKSVSTGGNNYIDGNSGGVSSFDGMVASGGVGGENTTSFKKGPVVVNAGVNNKYGTPTITSNVAIHLGQNSNEIEIFNEKDKKVAVSPCELAFTARSSTDVTELTKTIYEGIVTDFGKQGDSIMLTGDFSTSFSYDENVIGEDASGNVVGGGAAGIFMKGNLTVPDDFVCKSGKGGDGMVLIYA